MPWQQHVLDVVCELDEEGLPAYREVVITVPRQNGKTLLIQGLMTHRSLAWGSPQRVAYTAQDGNAAAEKLLDDMVPLWERSKFKKAIRRVYRSNGKEHVAWRNGSLLKIVRGADGSGHGKTLDQGVLDEAWEFVDDRLEQAVAPAMVTRADAQMFIPSTAGKSKSVFFLRKVRAGREAVAADTGRGVAFFEWSLPDDVDPRDPTGWPLANPACGYTIRPDTLATQYQSMEFVEFCRAHLNMWPDLETAGWQVIPEDVWSAVQDVAAAPLDVVFGLAVGPDHDTAAVVAVSPSGDVELVDYLDAEDGWSGRSDDPVEVAGRVAAICGRNPGRVALDKGGPEGALIPELVKAGVEVVELSGPDVIRACGGLYRAVADRKVRVRPSDVLTASVRGAVKKPITDRWVWSRTACQFDAAPIMAATVGWGAAVGPGEKKQTGFAFVMGGD